MTFAKNPLHKSVKGDFCIVLGALSAMSFAISPENYAGMSAVPAAATSYLWSALAACFAWALFQVFCKKGEKLHVLSVMFALIFGVVNAFGGHLFAYDSWDMSRMEWLLAVLRMPGQALPMTADVSPEASLDFRTIAEYLISTISPTTTISRSSTRWVPLPSLNISAI